jgi:hypothetical protein
MPAAKTKPATKKAAPAKPARSRKAAAPPQSPAPAVKAARAAKAVKTLKADKADKARKPKLVRDSFTIPKNEYTVLEALKVRAAKLGRPVKKSEVLRAGVMALADMGDAAFLACVTGVPAVKTGRPSKSVA